MSSVKTNGKELKTFWELGEPWWPKDGFVDGDSYKVNGITMGDEFEPNCSSDTDQITILSGYIYGGDMDDEGKSLTNAFKKWRKSLTMVQVVVEIHKDELPAFKREMSSYGAKIVS